MAKLDGVICFKKLRKYASDIYTANIKISDVVHSNEFKKAISQEYHNIITDIIKIVLLSDQQFYTEINIYINDLKNIVHSLISINATNKKQIISSTCYEFGLGENLEYLDSFDIVDALTERYKDFSTDIINYVENDICLYIDKTFKDNIYSFVTLYKSVISSIENNDISTLNKALSIFEINYIVTENRISIPFNDLDKNNHEYADKQIVMDLLFLYLIQYLIEKFNLDYSKEKLTEQLDLALYKYNLENESIVEINPSFLLKIMAMYKFAIFDDADEENISNLIEYKILPSYAEYYEDIVTFLKEKLLNL